MKVWWCEEHRSGLTRALGVREKGIVCHKALFYGIFNCSFVEMQLVPADARTETQCPNCKCIYEVAT